MFDHWEVQVHWNCISAFWLDEDLSFKLIHHLIIIGCLLTCLRFVHFRA